MSAAPQTESVILLSATEVLSRRHAPSWMAFALAAGSVNAGAVIACERFVSHVTGTVTLIGMQARDWLLMLDFTLVLVAFVLGAMGSVLAIQARVRRGQPALHALPLWIVAGVLVVTAIAGQLGLFGPLGGAVNEPTDFALLCVLAFAMGLMNASIATSTALSVRTTHMTGPATDFGVHLATAWLATGSERRHALRMAALRGGKLVAFAAGAGLMIPAIATFGYSAFVIPASVIAYATARSLYAVGQSKLAPHLALTLGDR